MREPTLHGRSDRNVGASRTWCVVAGQTRASCRVLAKILIMMLAAAAKGKRCSPWRCRLSHWETAKMMLTTIKGLSGSSRRIVTLLLLVFLPLGLAGCGGGGGDGPELGTVTGKVTLDGEALPNAVVMFSPAGAPSSFGTTDSSGEYSLRYSADRDGVALGKCGVRITTFSDGTDEGRTAGPEKVPTKYNDQSELTAEVKAGANTFDFPLDSKGEIVQPSGGEDDDEEEEEDE